MLGRHRHQAAGGLDITGFQIDLGELDEFRIIRRLSLDQAHDCFLGIGGISGLDMTVDQKKKYISIMRVRCMDLCKSFSRGTRGPESEMCLNETGERLLICWRNIERFFESA